MVWIDVITVIAFIAVCEIVLVLARRSPLVAKLYGLGYLVKTDRDTRSTDADADVPTSRAENELL